MSDQFTIHFDGHTERYEVFSAEDEWLGAYDTFSEAKEGVEIAKAYIQDIKAEAEAGE